MAPSLASPAVLALIFLAGALEGESTFTGSGGFKAGASSVIAVLRTGCCSSSGYCRVARGRQFPWLPLATPLGEMSESSCAATVDASAVPTSNSAKQSPLARRERVRVRARSPFFPSCLTAPRESVFILPPLAACFQFAKQTFDCPTISFSATIVTIVNLFLCGKSNIFRPASRDRAGVPFFWPAGWIPAFVSRCAAEKKFLKIPSQPSGEVQARPGERG